MFNTRGLHFRTSSGSRYYYDDLSGMCFPCPDDFAAALGKLTDQSQPANDEAIAEWLKFIVPLGEWEKNPRL